MKRKKYAVLILVLGMLLGGCGEKDDSGVRHNSEVLQDSMVQNDFVEEGFSGQEGGGESVDQKNSEILAACGGTMVTQTIEISVGGVITINAQIDVDGISRVSHYRYVPLPFTDESRKALLRDWFPAEGWDVNKAALYNVEKDAWEFVTPRGESWICQVSVSEIPGEQIMNLEKAEERENNTGESIFAAVQIDNEAVEEDTLLLLMEITGCTPGEIEQIGKKTIKAVTDMDTYSCNYIHICEESGGQRYARAVFKQVLDGMPVTVWHNFSTVTKNSAVFPDRGWGSLFSLEEIGLDKPILTPEEAVAAMQEQTDSIPHQEEQILITKISLEYLAVISSAGEPEIVPIWRFWPGADEAERCRSCERILAVNAVNGEVIWEERGTF